MPTTLSLAVILVILATAVGASLIATRGQGRRAVEPTRAELFRDATPPEVAGLSQVIARRHR